jgi:hypothetical protein
MVDEPSGQFEELQRRIREVAYLMWEAAGAQHGRALEFWLAAEREVLRRFASEQPYEVDAPPLAAGRDAAAATSPPPTDEAPRDRR